MAFNKGPSIISNGLYYYIDPANSNYYSGSTTTINNMIGAPGPNLNLINNPSYNSTNAGVLAFDGASSYIQVPQDSVTMTQGSSDFSIGGWIYPTRTGPNNLWAAYFAGQQYYPATFINVSSGASGSSGMYLQYYTGAVYNTYIVNAPYSMSINNWYNYCGVVQRSTTTFTAYINGYSIGSATIPSSWSRPISDIQIFSNYATGNTDFFGGYLGPMYLYSRALNSSEILQNYNAIAGRYSLT